MDQLDFLKTGERVKLLVDYGRLKAGSEGHVTSRWLPYTDEYYVFFEDIERSMYVKHDHLERLRVIEPEVTGPKSRWKITKMLRKYMNIGCPKCHGDMEEFKNPLNRESQLSVKCVECGWTADYGRISSI